MEHRPVLRLELFCRSPRQFPRAGQRGQRRAGRRRDEPRHDRGGAAHLAVFPRPAARDVRRHGPPASLMALLIRGGRIITATEDFTGDIYAENETITRIEPQIDPRLVAPGAEVIEARGKYVFPGFIDPHVHIYLPFMGTYSKDTYETGSQAALVGGTTTLIEMCCPARKDDALASFDLWMSQAAGKSACDFSFHMG